MTFSTVSKEVLAAWKCHEVASYLQTMLAAIKKPIGKGRKRKWGARSSKEEKEKNSGPKQRGRKTNGGLICG